MGKKRNNNAGSHSRSGSGTSRLVSGTAAGRSSSATGYLIHSNAPWTGTGYGVQTAALAQAIKREKETVTLSVNYGLQGGISSWEGIEVLPCGFTPYSADVLSAHTKYAEETTKKRTALITLFDCWVFKSHKIDDVPVIASWVPIDHTPAPPDVLDWCQRDNVLPIAMSRFGEQMLHNADIDSMYAPHSVDTSVFKPDATISGAPGRSVLNIPEDAFLVGMVAANKGPNPLRKAWGENLLAMAQFMQQRDDVFLYIHSEKRGAQGGIDLVKLAHACGIPEDRLVWVDQWAYYAGLPQNILAGIMASLDVHLMCSRGEGFGVPVLETAACGVPSIVSAFTAQPELVADHGWVTAVQPDWDALQSSWFATPLIHSIIENLTDAYETARDAERRSAARSHAEFYEHSEVFNRYWKPILTEIDKRMDQA